MEKTTSNYIPGVCNINQDEIKQRRNAGHLGLAIFLVLLSALLVLDVDRWYRGFLFLPALLMTIGYLQARHKFCVGYASSEMQHADDEVKKVAAEAVAKDKKRAKEINAQAMALAVAIAVLTVLIP